MKLEKNTNAPFFELKNQDGNTVSLDDFKGKKLFIYFYPRANTPGCTTQSCEVRDFREELLDLGVEVLGISNDDPKKQKKFEDKNSLNFPLLCDENHSVSESYGVWGEKKLYGKVYMGLIRSSFLIDENGKIMESWYKISTKKTIPELFKYLKK